MAKGKINIMTTKRIAVLSLMVALILIFSFVPISFGTISLALMILPVLLIAQVEDFKTASILGLFLGAFNYLAWFTTKAASPVAPLFQDPFVCIIPRLLIGVFSYLLGDSLRKLVKKFNRPLKKAQISALDNAITAVSTVVGVVTNTVFVAIFTLLFYNNKTLINGVSEIVINIEYVLAWFGLNFLIEVISFPILVTSISYALKKANLTYQKLYFVTPFDSSTAPIPQEAEAIKEAEANAEESQTTVTDNSDKDIQ